MMIWEGKGGEAQLYIHPLQTFLPYMQYGLPPPDMFASGCVFEKGIKGVKFPNEGQPLIDAHRLAVFQRLSRSRAVEYARLDPR